MKLTRALACALLIVWQAAPVQADVMPASLCDAPPSAGAWAVAQERFRGLCRPANYQEAALAMKNAADAGNACAAGALGLMTGQGWGVPRDTASARVQLQASAERGCLRVPYWTWLLLKASARPATQQEAHEHLTLGAALGDGHALNALGAWHESAGRRDEAHALYQRAAAAGNLTARQNLARLQRQVSRSSERPELAELIRQADQGNAQAMYLLARRLHQGDGVAVNHVEALQRYQHAAQLGHAAAREMLDLIHARIGPRGRLRPGTLAELSRVELRRDELNKTRGLTQPLQDEDPLAGL